MPGVSSHSTADGLPAPVATLPAVDADAQAQLRRVIHRALSAGSLSWSTGASLATLALFAFTRRHASVAEVVSAWPSQVCLTLAAAGVVLLARRNDWLQALDRRFFRQQYEANQLLAQLIERTRLSRTVGEWFDLVSGAIDRALHVEQTRLLVRHNTSRRFSAIDGSVLPLAVDGAIATLLGADTAPLTVDLDNPSSPLHLLPLDARLWLADSGARLLVPLPSSDLGTVGILALGEKRSELPYTLDDRLMLVKLAASGGLVLENHLLRAASAGGSASDGPADAREAGGECPACGLVQSLERGTCRCGARLDPLPLPLVLLGKFRLERRLGSGGMGVVYAATDLALERTVALKTLPQVTPERATRLRREARSMARVQHHNLALIYGAESWFGIPILVVEYLEGGTLLDRVAKGPLLIQDAVAIGASISAALTRLHDNGLLHRDVKPSNIGFKASGTAKLLDFGLARLAGEVATAHRPSVPEPTGQTDPVAPTSATAHLVGTPLYMSPEARQGCQPDAQFDLWALAMTLYEGLAGAHPFRGDKGSDAAAQAGRVDDIRLLRPDCPEHIALLLADTLSSDLNQRPASAREFRIRLHASTGVNVSW